MNRSIRLASCAVLGAAIASLSLAGCDKSSPTPAPAPGAGATPPKPPSPTTTAGDAKGHDHDHDHDHDHAKGHDHDDAKGHGQDGHGPAIPLGERTADGFTIKASSDAAIAAGHEAAIDVWVSGGASAVSSVRFWIGTRDAAGSMKAKADKEGDHWHAHAEVPKTLPSGSMLWVEVEAENKQRTLVSFDLPS